MLKSARWTKGIAFSILALAVCGGSACPVDSIGVTCSNNLDASEFGFTLVVPPEFVCTTVLENAELFVSARFRNASTGTIISVILSPESEAQSPTDDGVTTTDLDPRTTANGITFQRAKVVIDLGGLNFTSFVGANTITAGRELGITVVDETDDGSLETLLNQILETVELVN